MLKHEQLTETVIGFFYDVYNELGHGFLEAVYQRAMYIALIDAGLVVEQQKAIPVRFRDKEIGQFFADLVVSEQVVLELKVARSSTVYMKRNCFTI